MRRTIISASIIVAVAAVVVGATTAFFSDTETSPGNTLTAGGIDLKIDNTSYLNGQLNRGTTWQLSDLTNQLFFDFADMKPGDWGEDTISLHVFSNDAWACMNIQQTADDDVDCTEPELSDDSSCDDPDQDPNDGELGSELNFVFWADDGDNVLEIGEHVFQGPDSAHNLFDGTRWTLADSDDNIWTDNSDDPIIGSRDYWIGKAWCFGDLSPAPLPQSSGGGRATTTPAEDGNGNGTPGEAADGGFLCDGSNVNNASQTDKKMADVRFYSEQSRNNAGFVCNPNSNNEEG